MLYDLKDIVQSNDAKIKLRKLIEEGCWIELTKKKEKRTTQQNKALHKFFMIICERLNEMGMEFQYTGIKGLELSTRYTETIVKEFFWKPIQYTLFEVESTTKLNTNQINEVAEVIIKFFAEKGVYIEFPRKKQS